MAVFAGKYTGTIDDKGRVVLPAAFKKTMGELKLDTVVLEKNRRTQCVDIHTVEAWEKKVEAFVSVLEPDINPEDDEMLDIFYENFTTINVAANGRINIPAELLEYASLESKVVFKGMRDSIRLTAEAKEEKRKVSDEEYMARLKLLRARKRGEE